MKHQDFAIFSTGRLGSWQLSIFWILCAACGPRFEGHASIATLEVVRTPVELRGAVFGHAVAGDERLGAGERLLVADKAQALLRHDQGARLLLDGSTRAEVTGDGLKLQEGRIWVDARPGGRVQIEAAGAQLIASGTAGAGFEVSISTAKTEVTVLRGEVSYELGAKRGIIHAGELLQNSGATSAVSPVTLWEDWTGGLGWPDPRKGRGAEGIGEVGARPPGNLGEARFPLSIARLQVRTRIEDDLAVTTVEETFFNPADATLEGIFRVRLPEGAILSRFAIDRHGRYIDGYVKERETAQRDYQAQVYQGSTKDPALLEWEAPGSFKARLYPLPPGSSRRVLFTYSEWLQPHGADGSLRTYRYPMAGLSNTSSPLIQELDIEVDAGASGSTQIRAGLGALLSQEGRRVIMARTDYAPSADLVVEMVSPPRPSDIARVYHVPHQVPSRPGARSSRGESDYVLIRALPEPAPTPSKKTPIDLVLLVDISAATDATHLAMARTLIDAVLRRLDADDRITLLGADLDAHGLTGKKAPTPQLALATPEQIRAISAQLGQAATGGATDLGAVLSQAAALLQPERSGAVLYVGDARPTVGELDLPALRERLSRLPVPLRLYGVGIGAEANLDLLSGLCQMSAGQAYRIADRSAAAETALSIVSHLSRPVLSQITVDVGAGLDRVYPRQKMSLRAGDPLFILARLRQSLPPSVKVEGVAAGQPFSKIYRLEPHSLDDTADLRLRWSQARLLQLLDGGASTEEVAELGVRQNLITPFTSFYVPSEDEVALLHAELPDVRSAGCSYERAPARSVASTSMAPSAAPPPVSMEGASGGEGGRMVRKMRKRDSAAKNEEAPKEQEIQPEAPAKSAAADDAPAAAAPAPPPPPPSAAAPEPMMERMEKKKASRRADKDMLIKPMLDGVGESYGSSGLGLVGRGRGGGGTGSGTLGLGVLGTIGHGSNRSAGKTARSRPKGAADKIALFDDEDRAAPADESNVASSDTLVAVNDRDVTVVIGILRHRPRGCSAASSQPLDERRDLWRERLSANHSVRRVLEVYQDAERGCELPRWTDRRELLKLMLKNCGGASSMVSLYQHFGDKVEEQEFLRQAILGEVKNPRDLRIVYDGLGLGDEERATLAQEVVRVAKTPDERLRRIEELLRKWPGDMRLRLLRMETEELLGNAEAARRTAEEVRRDLYADAQARTAVGELFIRLGDEVEARRAFSEIVEFAPRDPLARRRLGDLYRAHGWWNEAYRQYQTLQTLEPSDQSVLLLLASAAAGAGHIEEALDLEQRVVSTSEPGGETGVSRIALWQTALRLAALREEARQKNDAESLARLFLRAQKVGVLGLARPVRVLLTWAHPEADLELKVGELTEPLGPAVDLAPQLGLLGWRSSQSATLEQPYRIEVLRGDRAAALKYGAELTVIVHEGEKTERLWRLPIAFDEKTPMARFTLRDGKVEKAEAR